MINKTNNNLSFGTKVKITDKSIGKKMRGRIEEAVEQRTKRIDPLGEVEVPHLNIEKKVKVTPEQANQVEGSTPKNKLKKLFAKITGINHEKPFNKLFAGIIYENKARYTPGNNKQISGRWTFSQKKPEEAAKGTLTNEIKRQVGILNKLRANRLKH